MEAADGAGGAARDADTGDENDEEYGDGSDGGAGQEIEEDVIKVHEDEYAARGRVWASYEEAWTKVLKRAPSADWEFLK